MQTVHNNEAIVKPGQLYFGLLFVLVALSLFSPLYDFKIFCIICSVLLLLYSNYVMRLWVDYTNKKYWFQIIKTNKTETIMAIDYTCVSKKVKQTTSNISIYNPK